jgi:ComF family protein
MAALTARPPRREPGAIRRLAGRLTPWIADLEAFLLPMRCPGCGAVIDAEHALCGACLAAIPRLTEVLCVRCLAAGREPPGCGREPGYKAWAAWVYDERAARAVHALKYHGRPRLARTLGRAIANALPSAYRPELVLEVPLHPTRRRERGYNQAGLLADATANGLGSPRLEGGLRRARPTRPQARLGPAARRANLAGSIQVVDPRALEGRDILVVDDVITTGSTLEACLRALAACGARAAGAALAWAP